MTTLTQLAAENGIVVKPKGYVPPADDGKTITAPADHPKRDENPDLYQAGDLVEPNVMVAAHLRIAAAYRTPGGRLSAEAGRAKAEVTRRKGNRKGKKEAKSTVKDLLAAKGLLD
jgi:hypothetical protein